LALVDMSAATKARCDQSLRGANRNSLNVQVSSAVSRRQNL
jgi:hypothetical protein